MPAQVRRLAGPLKGLLGALIILFVLEVLLGLIVPHHENALYVPDPMLFWRMRAGVQMEQRSEEYDRARHYLTTHIRTNALGLRGEELPPKTAGEYRILIVGDSTIFGHGVELEKTIEKQLERRLRAAFPKRIVRVVNGGVSGYSSFQGRLFLHEIAPRVQPDVIILAYYFSDFIPDVMADKQRVPPDVLSVTLRAALSRSQIYQLLRDEIERRAGLRAERSQGASMVARVSVDDYAANLRAMIEETQRLGARAAMLLLDPRAVPIPTNQRPYRDAMTQLAAQYGLPLIDMEAPFENAEHREKLFLDDVHPSPQGDALIAERLFEALRPQVRLPRQ